MLEAPLPRTWWVRNGLLLAGGFPGDVTETETVKTLRRLLDVGVRCFVSLQEPNEMSLSGGFIPYVPLAVAQAREMNVKITCQNFPIMDMGVPDVPLMIKILDAINQAVREEQCVYLHCWGGHGRTATVVGCWLREHGFSGREALQRIEKLRRHDPYLVQWESPQTEAQRMMILDWNSRPSNETSCEIEHNTL